MPFSKLESFSHLERGVIDYFVLVYLLKPSFQDPFLFSLFAPYVPLEGVLMLDFFNASFSNEPTKVSCKLTYTFLSTYIDHNYRLHLFHCYMILVVLLYYTTIPLPLLYDIGLTRILYNNNRYKSIF